MKKLHLLKTVLLLCALIVGSSSVWAEDVIIATGSFEKTTVTSGWTSTGTGTGTKKCIIYGKGESLTSPALDLSGYSKITVSISARRFGSLSGSKATIDVSVGGSSKGTVNATSTSVSALSNIEFTPTSEMTSVSLVFTCTNATSAGSTHGAGIGSITITGTPKAPSYTITAVSNNDSWGTVSGTTTITATPSDGYRVVAGDDGYTVTSGTATVTNNGDNTFSVSASTDCTIQINFEAIPTHTLSSVVSPVAKAGTVTFGSSTVREGATTSATASANSGYKFTGWSITGTGATLSSTSTNPTTVTMGTADATITANFEAVTTYAISYSVNGVIIDTQNVEEGAAIDLSAPESGIPSGYTFKGWVTEANKIDTPTDTDPSANYVTSATSTADITYYAVMAIDDVSSATATLTASHTKDNTTYGDHEYTDDKGNTWSGNTNEPYESSVARIGLRSTGGSYLESPTFSGNVTDIKIMTYNGSSTKNRTFYIKSEQSGETDLGTVTAPSGKKLTEEQTATLTGTDFKKFFLTVSDAVGFSYISVTYETTTSSNYCTIATVPATITTAEYATFVSPYATDFSTTGITVYTAKDNTTYVKLNEVTSGQVPANTPVVLYKAGANGSAIDVPVIAKAAAVGSNDLRVSTGTDVENMYVLANKSNGVGFYPWGGTTDLSAGKVYLQAKASYGAREFIGFGDDETTDIKATLRSNEMMNGEVYNLAGQRIAQPTKGLYIVNGKKVVIK